MTALAASRTPLTLVQSFGFAAFLIAVGVMATWIYLKRSAGSDGVLSAELELLALAPLEAAPAAPAQAAVSELDTWVQFAEEAYAAGRIVTPVADNALYYFEKALEEAPDHAAAQNGMERVLRHLVSGAESAIFQGDWQGGRSYAERLQEIRPDDPRAAGLLARINRFEQLENLLARADRQEAAARLTEPPGDNALETYRRILEIEAGNESAKQGIASIVQRLLGFAQSAALAGEQDKAVRHLRKVRAIDARAPGLADAEQLVAQWSELVSNQQLQEQLEAASLALEEGRLTTPDEPNALSLFEAVLTQDPASEAAKQGKRLVLRALTERAWGEIRAGRFRDAETTIEHARLAGAESYTLVELEDEILYAEALARARRGEFDRLYAISDLEPKRRGVPEYPRTASGEGWVELRFTVDEAGQVVDATVFESSNATFEDAAVKAIYRWSFKPPLYKGKPIPVRSGARFSFKE